MERRSKRNPDQRTPREKTPARRRSGLSKARRQTLAETFGGMADAFAELQDVMRRARTELRRLEVYARGGRALLSDEKS